MENSVLQHRMQVAQNIEKSCTEGIELQKARSGVYSDNAENRKLNRVGQQYGGKKQPEQASGGNGNSKGEDEPNHAEHAKKASTEALKRAASDEKADEKVRTAAKEELKNRGEGGKDDKGGKTQQSDSYKNADKDVKKKYDKILKESYKDENTGKNGLFDEFVDELTDGSMDVEEKYGIDGTDDKAIDKLIKQKNITAKNV